MVLNPDLEQLKIFKDYDLEPEIYNIAGLKQVLTLVSSQKFLKLIRNASLRV